LVDAVETRLRQPIHLKFAVALLCWDMMSLQVVLVPLQAPLQPVKV
jgi:hypothetical protein